MHHRVEALARLVVQVARFLPHVDAFLCMYRVNTVLNFDDDDDDN